MVEISVFIPVYRESKLTFSLLERLIHQKVNKEIFVVVDEPTRKFLDALKKFEGSVRFIINGKRVGKAEALNRAVESSSGEILLFLDSDVELPDNPDFLKKIIERMKRTDFLDLKKRVVRTSFLSKMTYYEYIGLNIGAWIVMKYLRGSPAINGSAFAIRREVFTRLGGFRRVVAEDLDIATRAFLRNYRFEYAEDIEVRNYVHSSWREWIKQRKRWSLGTALWLKKWYRDLLKKLVKKPQSFIPALYFLYPSLVLLALNLLVPNTWFYKLLFMSLLVLAMKINIALPILTLSAVGANFLKNSVISLVSFISFSLIFTYFAKKLRFELKLHELLPYYFFYSFIWLMITIISLIQVVVFNKSTVEDWKI